MNSERLISSSQGVDSKPRYSRTARYDLYTNGSPFLYAGRESRIVLRTTEMINPPIFAMALTDSPPGYADDARIEIIRNDSFHSRFQWNDLFFNTEPHSHYEVPFKDFSEFLILTHNSLLLPVK
jgi:hypothetical protein